MVFVVFNKETDKYLNNHSGSYNRYTSNIRYKNYGYNSSEFRYGSDEHKEYCRQLNKAVEAICYQAEAKDSRMYRSKGGAVNSVGHYRAGLPDHLAIHEVVVTTTIVKE